MRRDVVGWNTNGAAIRSRAHLGGRGHKLLLLVAACSLFTLLVPGRSIALSAGETFVVNTAADGVDANPGDGACRTATAGQCTLRAAIQETNAIAGMQTITFDAALNGTPIVLTIRGSGEDFAATGDLDLRDSVAISGNGVDNTIIHGDRFTEPDGVFHGHGTLLPRMAVYGSGFAVYDAVSGYYSNGGKLVLQSVALARFEGAFGGLRASDGAVVTVSDSTISGNVGGGIVAEGGSTVTVLRSTINGNISGGDGGGMRLLDRGTLVMLVNTTVSGNTANGFGGGVYAENGTLRLASSTVAGNSAAAGGGIFPLAGTTVTLKNTILATNTASGAGPDCGDGSASDAPLTSEGYNLLGNNSGCDFAASTGDQVGTAASPINPKLGPLADNGGPTQTRALLPGSPALDTANPTGCTDTAGTPLATDQRGAGYPRSSGGRCDIGAYEAQMVLVNVNPSFEADANADGTPDGWSRLNLAAGTPWSAAAPTAARGPSPSAGAPATRRCISESCSAARPGRSSPWPAGAGPRAPHPAVASTGC